MSFLNVILPDTLLWTDHFTLGENETCLRCHMTFVSLSFVLRAGLPPGWHRKGCTLYLLAEERKSSFPALIVRLAFVFNLPYNKGLSLIFVLMIVHSIVLRKICPLRYLAKIITT